MNSPPPDPRYHLAPDEPTLQSILAAYAVVAAFPLLLWVISNPLAGAVTVLTTVTLITGARRAVVLVRCFYECQGFTVDLGGKVRITVAQP